MDAGGEREDSPLIGVLAGRPGRWRAMIGLGVIGVAGIVCLAVAARPAGTYPYLAPRILLTVVAIVGVVLTLPADRRDDPLDPITFAIATYFVPFTVIGALLLAGGWSTPAYAQLIVDPRHNLPLAQLYVVIGIVALAIGSRLAIGRSIAASIDRRAPSLRLDRRRIALGLIAVHVAGLSASIWAFRAGYLGYQTVSPGLAGALPAYLATALVPARIGVAMIWVLDGPPRSRPVRAAALVSLLSVPVEMALGASRATVVVAALAVAFGALAAGWRPRLGRVVAVCAVGALVGSFSIVFGTTFRALKNPAGTERTVSIGDQVHFALEAAGETLRRGPLVVPDALSTASRRLESTAQIAVVVSQYRARHDEEVRAGIDNSVVGAITAGAVPRVLWPGKPEPPDQRVISAIYFRQDDSSFATTPLTDLLRNFGPIGVPAGMAVLGIGLGTIGALRRRRERSIATNMVIGAILIRGVSYEGFYGAIVSDSVRVGAVAAAAALAVKALSRSGAQPSVGETEQQHPGEATRRRAVVVSVDLSQRGGHQGATSYLHDCLEREGWTVDVVSLATSAGDRNSMLLRSPRTWRSPRVTTESYDGRPYRHVGCWAAEVPFLRARPRRALDRELAGHDAIVMAVGSPFWSLVVPLRDRARTVVEFVTRYDDEVVSAREAATGWRRVFWAVQRRVVALQERRALETVAAVIVPSDDLAAWARSHGVVDATVVPHAIGDRFVPGPAGAGSSILAVGRWCDPRKNVTLLLDAYELAVTALPSIDDLVLVGTPPAGADGMLAARRERIIGRARFLGEVDAAELVALLQSAGMLVLASDQEGFGLPLVEAMACGCPVIATRSGGSELTVVDGVNGLLVPRRDPDALAAALVRLATDDELRSTLGRGALASASAYRIGTIAPALAAVAERVGQGASSVSRRASVDA